MYWFKILKIVQWVQGHDDALNELAQYLMSLVNPEQKYPEPMKEVI